LGDSLVKISAKCCYSVLAGVELARSYPGGEAVRVKDLSTRTGVPEGFLVQILQSLRKAGLVESVRGAGGGYRLASPPQEVAVGSFLRASQGCSEYVETSSFADEALEQGGSPAMNRALGFVLSEAERSLARVFDNLTLAAVLERGTGQRFVADYQI
jgi:Rrf2 family protein